MTTSKRVFSFVFLALFMFGFVGSINANVEVEEESFPSNTGYWVMSGNNTFYCEWSFFEWSCKSGSSSGPGTE